MTLNQKETTVLNDLKSQEQLCVEKYQKCAKEACDTQLKDLFSQIAMVEQEHVNTLNQIESGTVPQMNSGASQTKNMSFNASCCSVSEKENDKFLCTDALSTEKYVSADYNTCIFEFRDSKIREALNHIQKEEQQHGKQIYNYMAKNGMYQ